MVIVNEHDNHDRQRLDSSLVYIGAHNVYYVKSCLSDAKCFSSCWNDYGGWYDTDHINLVQGSAFAGSYSHIKDRCTGIM